MRPFRWHGDTQVKGTWQTVNSKPSCRIWKQGGTLIFLNRGDMDVTKIALVVIDMINDFVKDRECPLFCPDGEEALGRIVQLVDFFHDHELQVIFVKDAHRKNDGDFLVRPVHGVQGTWGAELAAPLKERVQEQDYIINKRRHSAFSYTDFDLFLREEKIDLIVLAGGWTNTGIRSTASDAFYQAYQTITIGDCCFSQTEEMHLSGLRDIAMFGQVMTLRKFTDYYEMTWGTGIDEDHISRR